MDTRGWQRGRISGFLGPGDVTTQMGPGLLLRIPHYSCDVHTPRHVLGRRLLTQIIKEMLCIQDMCFKIWEMLGYSRQGFSGQDVSDSAVLCALRIYHILASRGREPSLHSPAAVSCGSVGAAVRVPSPPFGCGCVTCFHHEIFKGVSRWDLKCIWDWLCPL